MVYKATDLIVTKAFLDERVKALAKKNYPKPKWIMFCETLLNAGYHITLYEARSTCSKYITIHEPNNKKFKIRFSNHRPNRFRESNKDCDFFVGVSNFNITTTEDALIAVEHWFTLNERKKQK